MSTLLAWLDRWSIWLVVACLGVGYLQFSSFGTDSVARESLMKGRERIRLAIDAIPEALGPSNEWIKVYDEEVPPTQANMLGLTGHLARRYQRLGGMPHRATLFFAHSQDARSMDGHHPPNCYPQSGWTLDAESTQLQTVSTPSGRRLPLRIYRFASGVDSDMKLWVANGFVLPGEAPVASLEEAKRTMTRASRSRLGLAQYQLVFWDDLPVEDVVRFSVEMIGSLPDDLFEAVEGIGDTFADSATETIDE